MSSPRYIPRTFLPAGHRFGRSDVLKSAWRRDSRESGSRPDVECAASRLQHEVVRLMREALEVTGATPQDVCREGGFSPNRWRRLMSGEVIVRFDDLAAVEVVTGCQFVFALDAENESDRAFAAKRRLSERARLAQQERERARSRAQVRPAIR